MDDCLSWRPPPKVQTWAARDRERVKGTTYRPFEGAALTLRSVREGLYKVSGPGGSRWGFLKDIYMASFSLKERKDDLGKKSGRETSRVEFFSSSSSFCRFFCLFLFFSFFIYFLRICFAPLIFILILCTSNI